MKPWAGLIVIVWAVAATVAAVFFALQTAAPEVAETGEEAPSGLEAWAGRTTRRLQRRVERLHAALAATLPVLVEDEPGPSDGLATTSTPPPAERVLSLLDESRRLADSETWTVEASQALGRRLTALVARHPATHLALMQRLRRAADEDEALDVLEWLVESPFSHLVREKDVTDAIRVEARALTRDPRPHIRAVAARVLYAYDDATLEDVLAGIARLQTETDPGVREDLLAELSVAAKGHGLTIDQAEPLIEALRRWSETRGGGWAAGALASWSADASDLEHVTALLAEAKGANRAQEILNAFQRDTRLAGAHEATARVVLLGVMEDSSRDSMVRGLALDFLRDYAPWDGATADAARRYGAD